MFLGDERDAETFQVTITLFLVLTFFLLFSKIMPNFCRLSLVCSYLHPYFFLGDERDAEKFQVTITLFREEEYGRTSTNGDQGAFSAQRSYTGPVKFTYSEKDTKFCEIFPLFLTTVHTEVRGRFCKILWSSQNI